MRGTQLVPYPRHGGSWLRAASHLPDERRAQHSKPFTPGPRGHQPLDQLRGTRAEDGLQVHQLVGQVGDRHPEQRVAGQGRKFDVYAVLVSPAFGDGEPMLQTAHERPDRLVAALRVHDQEWVAEPDN